MTFLFNANRIIFYHAYHDKCLIIRGFECFDLFIQSLFVNRIEQSNFPLFIRAITG